MAESETRPPADLTVTANEEKKVKGIKYLDFVQVATVYVIVCFSIIYEYAKENSGPLRPGVQSIERAVKTVVGPVSEKLHDIPFQLLKFADRKVDESIIVLDHHVPVLLKLASHQAWAATHSAANMARELAREVQQFGLVDTASKIVKTAYIKYEPTAMYEVIAEQYAATAWRSLNGLPLFSQVAHIMVPTAAYWADKYNQVVAYSTERGYAVSYYLPFVPIERIVKALGAESEPDVSTAANGEYVSVS
ncbi:hypothetical protein OROHE_023986 [Orobanche hederae]